MAFRIREVRHALGMPVVLIAHDMRLVEWVSDRVMALDRGALVAAAAPQQISVDPRVVETYLGE